MTRLKRAEENIAGQARMNHAQSATPGLDVVVTPGGTVSSYTDPKRTRWVFVIGFDGDTVLCREGIRGTAYWSVDMASRAIIRAHFPGGYTVGHFTFFQIGLDDDLNPIPGWDGQPSTTDLMCKLEGGLIVTDNRMKLVEPAAVEDLCEPCGNGAAASRPRRPVSIRDFTELDALEPDDFQCCGGSKRGT